MKKIFLNWYFVVLFLILLFSGVAYFYANTTKVVEVEEGRINYFYSKTCSACAQMTPFLNEMEEKYGVSINYYDVSSNSNLFRKFLSDYNVPSEKSGYVPAVFIDEQYFVGFSPSITGSIEQIIQGKEIDEIISTKNETIQTKILGFWNVDVSLSGRSLLFVTFLIAFLDSLNVCSITVLIFLVVYSLSIGSLKRAFKIGLIFTIIIFLFYTSFMLFLSGFIGMFMNNFGIFMRLFLIFVSFVAGVLLIKDFFWYGKWITLRVPESAKPLLEKYMKQATISSAIVLGLVASLVELPCTAVFPLLYTAILAESSVVGLERIFYISLYNLIYVLPLLLIVFATYFSWTEISNIDQKIQKYKKHMKLVAGIALVILSLYFAYPLIN
jgi:thiol-disulfide isomerase/thioredoxin